MLGNAVPAPAKFEFALLEDARNREVGSGLEAASPRSTRDFYLFSHFFFSSHNSHHKCSFIRPDLRLRGSIHGLFRDQPFASVHEMCAAQCAGLKIRKMQAFAQAPVPPARCGMSFSKRSMLSTFQRPPYCGMFRSSRFMICCNRLVKS